MLVLFLFLFAKFVQGDDKGEWWENLLEDTDGVACGPRFPLTCALLMNPCILKADFEGGGLPRDGSKESKAGRFAIAVKGDPPPNPVVAVFVKMDNANCKVDSYTNPCFWKCMQKYEISRPPK